MPSPLIGIRHFDRLLQLALIILIQHLSCHFSSARNIGPGLSTRDCTWWDLDEHALDEQASKQALVSTLTYSHGEVMIRFTYKSPTHKVPHEVDLVLGCGWGHIRLLEIWCHGFMVGEFVEEGLVCLSVCSPVGVSIGWDCHGCELMGEMLSSGGVWVHGFGCCLKCAVKIE